MGSKTFRGPGLTGWRIAIRLAVVSFSKGTGRTCVLQAGTVASPLHGPVSKSYWNLEIPSLS